LGGKNELVDDHGGKKKKEKIGNEREGHNEKTERGTRNKGVRGGGGKKIRPAVNRSQVDGKMCKLWMLLCRNENQGQEERKLPKKRGGEKRSMSAKPKKSTH